MTKKAVTKTKHGLGYQVTQKGKQPVKDTRANIPVRHEYRRSLNKNIFLFIGMIAFAFFLGRFYGHQNQTNQVVKMEMPKELYYDLEEKINNNLEKRLEQKLDKTLSNIDRKIASLEPETKVIYKEVQPRVERKNLKEHLSYFDELKRRKKEAAASNYRTIDFEKYIAELNGVYKSYSHYLAEKSRVYRQFSDDLRHNTEVFTATHDFTRTEKAQYNDFLYKQSLLRAEFRSLLKKHNDKYLDYERTKRKSERFVYK